MTDLLRDEIQASLGAAYTLSRELGGGGMSRVFVAHEQALGRDVVVKVLSPELAEGMSAERFAREIRLLASLQQANIVPLLSAGSTNGLPYYTMPFVEGESLRARLGESPPLSMPDTLRILGDIARALQYAHERGIVHRDIKPDNVLLSGGTAVVTDFGIAKAVSVARTGGWDTTLTQHGTSIGTPAYMAPEQAAADPDIDHRADLYAFGCLAYEMLTGAPPFSDRAPQRVLAAHLNEAPPPIAERRSDLPAGLGDLVMRCLAKDPGDRPQSASEIIRTLDAVTSGGGVVPGRAMAVQAAGAFRRALFIYVAAVLVVAAAAKVATITIGLPDWVVPGALFVMALGLPVILVTGYVQAVTRRAITATPARTPGGTPAPPSTLTTLALKASPHVSWMRTMRGGIYALGGFVLLIVAFMGMRALGVGPAASLFASGKLARHDLVLISDFGVSHADTSVGRVVAEGVRANLAQSPSITLLSPASAAAALQRMQRAPATFVDLALARQLAEREGVKAIVTGDVTGLGNGFVIALRLVSVDSGNVLASYQTTVDGPGALVRGVDAVTRELRAKIGESLRSVQASPPLDRVTTPSYEALRLYTEADRANAEVDYPKAIALLRQAVSIDTGFAMAWRLLAVAMSNANYSQSAIDSAETQAFRLRTRLPEDERYGTEGEYYFNGPGHDVDKAMAAYQALLDRGDSIIAANDLGLGYMIRREYARAEPLYRIVMRKDPGDNISVGNLAVALALENKRTASDSFVALGLKRVPNDVLLLAMSLSRTFERNGPDAAKREADSLRAAASTPPVRRVAAQTLGNLAILRGRLGEGEQWMREANQLASGQRRGISAIADSNAIARDDAWFRNQPERAVRLLDATLAKLPLDRFAEEDRPYTELAVTYAMAGRPDRARALLAQFDQIRDTALLRSRQADIHFALGHIDLAEHHPREAVAEFRLADTLPEAQRRSPLATSFQVGRAFDLANEPDSAIAMFEQYLNRPGPLRVRIDATALAAVHKRLAELYDAKGDRAKAASHYAAFIDLWKNADPELQPEVAEARKRLAQLTNAERP